MGPVERMVRPHAPSTMQSKTVCNHYFGIRPVNLAGRRTLWFAAGGIGTSSLSVLEIEHIELNESQRNPSFEV